RRYSPISVIAATFETVSRPNCSSMATMSSRRRSKISFPLMEVVALNAFSCSVELVAAVIRELQIDAKVLLLDHRDDLLQRVAILAADPHYIALDGGLRFFLGVLDQLHDLARLFDWDALLQGDFLFHCASGGWLQRAIGQTFQGHTAFDQLLLEDVVHRLHLEFIGGVKHDGVRAFHCDLGLRVFQIKARADFLHRLLDGVGNLREVDFADDIETVIRHRMNPGVRCQVSGVSEKTEVPPPGNLIPELSFHESLTPNMYP